MEYLSFHSSRIGKTHLLSGLPCQDHSADGTLNGIRYAVVADGHGHRRHFRSQTGARLACKAVVNALKVYVEAKEPEVLLTDEFLNVLKQDICKIWQDEVLLNFAEFPWTDAEVDEMRSLLDEEELERLLDGRDALIPYGSTLCMAFVCSEGWAAVQLGDGCIVHVSSDSVYNWPMPESVLNQGNRTASLCMQEPMRDFRHCFGKDHPAALLLCTDGIEKSFPIQSAGIASFLHWVWKNACSTESNRSDELDRMLDTFTQRSAIGDDVSVAGIVTAPALQPKPSEAQLKKEFERVFAQLVETENTISFNMRRLERLRGVAGQSELEASIRLTIDKKRQTAGDLRAAATRMAVELGLPPPPEVLIQEPDRSKDSVHRAESHTQQIAETPTDSDATELGQKVDGSDARTTKQECETEESEPNGGHNDEVLEMRTRINGWIERVRLLWRKLGKTDTDN